MRWTRTLPLASERPLLITSAECPLAPLSSPLPDEPPIVWPFSVVPGCFTPGADADANAGDRDYLVLAKPNVIMNDIRLRGLAVAGTWASWHFRPNARFQPPRSLLGTTVSARQHAY